MTIPNNPVLQGFHADPEILYSHQTKKILYLFHHRRTARMGRWYFSVFSSDNLKDWKDEGVMLDLKSDQVAWADGTHGLRALKRKWWMESINISSISVVIL